MNTPGFFSRPLSVVYLLLLFLVIDFPYQYGFRYLPLPTSLGYALVDAGLYTALLFITARYDLARLTLFFLALPYLIFIAGWLNLPTALTVLAIFLFCLARTIKEISINTTTLSKQVTTRDFLAFLLILAWVNLSGIGGYGFQWPDYGINNARLHDLIVNPWPIRYGENRNFVYYFGYFLPSAVIGKLTSIDLAMRSVYLWAVFGITLAIRWLCLLSKWRFSSCLVLVFILFGSLDILNLLYIKKDLGELWLTFHNDDMDTLTFTTSQKLKFYSIKHQILFFLGNYHGNSFQLYWSPQQLIAGWLCAAFMMHLFLQNQLKKIVFIYALLCLWGPLVMLALLPFIFVIVFAQFFRYPLNKRHFEQSEKSNILVYKIPHVVRNDKNKVVQRFLNRILSDSNFNELFSFENSIGAGALAVLFLAFYLGGSSNPSFWLFEAVNIRHYWDILAIFYLAGWGIYSLALTSFILKSDAGIKIAFVALIAALAVLPLRIFGEWSDLLCRGSGPLMFLLLVFLLRAIEHYYSQRKKIQATLLLLLLMPGFASAILINKVSLAYYGQTEAVKSLPSYASIYPNFGRDDSLFNRLFRRDLPAPTLSGNQHDD